MFRVAVVILAVFFGVLHMTTAKAAEPETICIYEADPSIHTRWRIDGAIREWNSAQTMVHLTRGNMEGCRVITIQEYSADDGIQGHAVIGSNEIYLNTYPVIPPSIMQNRWTVAHEIGHALGLHHTTNRYAVMSNNPLIGWRKHMITAIDVRALEKVRGVSVGRTVRK